MMTPEASWGRCSLMDLQDKYFTKTWSQIIYGPNVSLLLNFVQSTKRRKALPYRHLQVPEHLLLLLFFFFFLLLLSCLNQARPPSATAAVLADASHTT